ncbi:Clavaminate synthase-like protein [Exidia glandulosa HHB12029]|uniref:Clavaminate synthase-like protein n=1 Tax=Exidia glandulosa HHB12029 TaxID=1314781 RepID=A0A165ZX44_EXIGL|nr:Clavaminate synthase-like protein [Exidia glandulosa HHB12029]
MEQLAYRYGSSPPSVPPELSPPSDRTSSADSLHPSPGSLALPLPRGNSSHPALNGSPYHLPSPDVTNSSLHEEHPRYCPKLPDVSDFGLGYHRVRMFHTHDLQPEVFRALWAEGEPIVVEGLLDRSSIPWTPQYFMQEFGTEVCVVIECQTDANKRVTVEEFFQKFGEYADRDGCWKLKDWPSVTDFKSVFPKLYEDFMRIVPMPDYARRDGVLNISSHFPANALGPDLGPKMYNAFASDMEPGSKGSTKLHMDMADAVNIMHFATSRPDGGEGGAVWDIFRSQDSDAVRKFLRSRFKDKCPAGADPIHQQLYYLDRELLAALKAEHGVVSCRVYQRPGEAVFIPAGCAHQVCNLSDCIKVAVDFVSPENIERCENLTREFQAQTWKEDVLQLKTMLWYAWQSCSRLVHR